ncbi:putative F-box protein At5g55150 [Castanea sativa]|uniref:putative F-box protein At5g55150 n=1 Tax=Castanea sativa TaxID=21020 RepID=UPI003F64E3FB
MAPISCPSLPKELLELILQRVTDIVDLYQCSNVCHSWRSIARKQSTLLPPELLVLRIQNNVIEKIQMISMFTSSSSVCKIPEFNTRDGVRYMPMIVESSHGWLVINYNTSKSRKVDGHLNYICLYNPLSREEIWLPPLLLNSENPKFILSSKPANPSCIVLVLHEKKLVFWRFGDKKWTFLKNVEDWINDIICYKDEFHVLQMKGNPPYPEVPYLLQVKFSPKCHV